MSAEFDFVVPGPTPPLLIACAVCDQTVPGVGDPPGWSICGGPRGIGWVCSQPCRRVWWFEDSDGRL